MSWLGKLVSLFTNCTRVPGETVSCFGETPDDVIVMTLPEPEEGLGLGLGDVGLELPLPQAPNAAEVTSATAPIARRDLRAMNVDHQTLEQFRLGPARRREG